MFKFLKDKIRGAVSKFSKGVEKTPEEKLEEEKEKVIEKEEEIVDEKEEEIEEELKVEEKEPEKKSVVGKIREKITTKKIDDKKFEELFYDLELGLLESNVAVEVIDKIKENLKVDLVNVPLERKKIDNLILDSLKDTITELFKDEDFDLIEKIKAKEGVYVIAFLGVNGGGKTTSIAKIAKMLKDNRISCVLGAADTFRAAAINQLEEHGSNLGIKVIKHDYGADAAAVAFDTIKYAKAKNLKVVLIDTAGRMNSNVNLMDELKKIIRISNPDLKVFVGESITGNDCVEQARNFNSAVGIDGVILAKADIDEKGGTLVSISYVLDKPILYLGTGQNYGDIEKFNLEKLMGKLGL
ncbi:MAG: signal recognition particle-docking protein FtsY [Candidatus Woesearchaeota archaeon]